MPADPPRCPACERPLAFPGELCSHCLGLEERPGAGPAVPSPAVTIVPGALAPEVRYELIETIGRGGMGHVLKVRDRELDDVIALKVLDPQVAASQVAVERFKRELKIARRINHPNVARLYDLLLWHGQLAISMEYIEGLALDQLLAQGPINLAAIRRYLRYICSALQAAHQLGVVHRDLKPANVLVDSEDRAHVLDFGIALLAGSPSLDTAGSVFGTPWYMAPEQAFQPEIVDHRADVYSLGVLLYRMATGEVPFPGTEAHEVFLAHLKKAPLSPRVHRPDLPAPLEEVILTCLEKRPTARYQSAREVFAQLEAGLEREGAARPREGVPPVAVAPGRRGKVLVVDDDRLTRRMVGDLLRERGVVVVEAKDGFEGVQKALEEKPDFVLLDLVMPVLDGREALRILKSNPATRDVPVVMLTALTDPDEALFSKEMGAAAFLNKPVEPDVLELLVEKYT